MTGVQTCALPIWNDTLKFADVADANELTAKIIGNDLVIAIKESGIVFEELSDKVTILNYKNNKIENITLSDNTSVNLNNLLLNPTQENDNLVSYENDSVIVDALGGDDSVTTGGGSDTITGGKGNDTLSGGAGNDIYIFNIGDAKDAILDINGDRKSVV